MSVFGESNSLVGGGKNILFLHCGYFTIGDIYPFFLSRQLLYLIPLLEVFW